MVKHILLNKIRNVLYNVGTDYLNREKCFAEVLSYKSAQKTHRIKAQMNNRMEKTKKETNITISILLYN